MPVLGSLALPLRRFSIRYLELISPIVSANRTPPVEKICVPTSTMSTSIDADALLFDMDGTLLDSTSAVLAVWEVFAKEYNLDLSEVLKTSHGVRTIDNMRRWCGLSDQAALQSATELFEAMIVSEAKRLREEGQPGLEILPGVQDLLQALNKAIEPSWAIVTSATSVYAESALSTAGIVDTPKLVTADRVKKGKPDPEPYLLGAELLGKDVHRCIVVEDAPSGIRSGVASGARVLAVCTSHSREQLEGLGAAWIVSDLSRVHAEISTNGRPVLHIDERP